MKATGTNPFDQLSPGEMGRVRVYFQQRHLLAPRAYMCPRGEFGDGRLVNLNFLVVGGSYPRDRFLRPTALFPPKQVQHPQSC